MSSTTGHPVSTRRGSSGFTLFETVVSILFVATAILTTTSVISRDMGAMTRNRVDLIGQTAVRKKMEERRLQPFTTFETIAGPPGCRDFTNDGGYEDLHNLPFGQGLECSEFFDPDRRRYTVITKVFERPMTAGDPNIRQFRAVTVVTRQGLNRQ